MFKIIKNENTSTYVCRSNSYQDKKYMKPESWKEGGKQKESSAFNNFIFQQLPRDSNKFENKTVPLIVFQCFRTQSATTSFCSKFLSFWFI